MRSKEGKFIDCKKIKEIREQYSVDILCKDFPKAFRKEFDGILKSAQNEEPNYLNIIKCFEEIKKSI